MSILIRIPSELEQALIDRAKVAGMDVQHYVEHIIKEDTKLDVASATEDELLKKVNLGIAQEKWERYHTLRSKREEETLSSTEHAELISISDEIEEANARRMPYLLQLAKLKNRSLEELIRELKTN
jgi:hypothetical protein